MPGSKPAAPGRAAAPAVQKPTGPPSMFLGGKPVEMLGKLYYRTADARIIELPSDMTKEQVIKLEADARAAVTKIGKGPPPQPVPDVKQLDKKTDKKTQLKPFAKGKGFGAAGKGGGKPQGRVSPSLAGVANRKVAQYLASKAGPIVSKGFARLQQLRQSQQKHDEAEEKRVQAEKAVLIPASEGQSKSNAGQVSVVGDRPAPKVDANKGKQTLQATLNENVPKTIEDVDNFKRDKKAEHTGAEVLKTIQEDKSSVVSTFQDMRHTPPPAPREHEPEALPPTEIAPPTGAMALGKDGIAPLQKEHTDLSNFTNDADKKLNEEGVTQEQLDMVDSGDLAAANKEKKGMEKSAKEEPIAVQKFSQEQGQNVEQELKKDETKQRGELNTKRKAGLSATKTKQQGAKSALEKKREEVAARINGIYTTAQDKVKKRLADLEIESMKRFDVGNDNATKAFEDNVNSEIDAFKEDRYSGMFGWARKVRDWIKGIDDLPPVKAIFDRNREKFVAAINKLVEDISADNKRVIQECKDELQRARDQIKEYVDSLGPSLKDIGKKAADEMNSKLAEMDKFIAKREEELQNKLKDKQTAAIKAIDEKIEKMKEAMAGALAKLGKLLLWAAKKFFTWALEKFGMSLGTIDSIINKGAAVLKAIFTKPIQFVKNLMKAAILGFENFGKNFLTHLQDALFEWLTGSLQGLVLPQTWDFPGIISVALQMVGISKQSIREVMEEVMGKPVVEGLLKTFTLLQTLITQGPMAAWEQLKDMAAEMRDAFIEAVKDFIKWKIVEEAIKWVAALLIPGAGIIKAIIGIYDTVVFFIQKAKQIFEMISNFLGSIAEIAAGNIGAAAAAMENGLKRGLSLVVSFLAALLRLTGITNKIRDALNKIRGKVRAALLKLAKWVWEKGKALFGKVVGGVKGAVGKVVQWWKTKKKFTAADGHSHTMSFKGEGKAAKLWIQSDPTPFETFIENVQAPAGPQLTAKTNAVKIARKMDDLRNKASTTDGTLNEADTDALEKLWNDLIVEVTKIFGAGKSSPPKYGPRSSAGWGGGMVMLSLANPSLGTIPTVKGTPFEALNIRRHGNAASPSTASYYILGHLLNQKLGGPGNIWENLTPLSRSGNAQHETQVEDAIKKVVDKGKTVRYDVQVRYGRGASALISKIPANTTFATDPILFNKKKVLEAEQYVPTSLLCRAVTVNPTSGAADPADGLNLTREVLNKVETNSLDDYVVPGQAALRLKVLAINDSVAKANSDTKHKDALLRLPGIGGTRINDLIRSGQPWRSFTEISEKIDGVTLATTDGWKAGIDGNVKVRLTGTSEWE